MKKFVVTKWKNQSPCDGAIEEIEAQNAAFAIESSIAFFNMNCEEPTETDLTDHGDHAYYEYRNGVIVIEANVVEEVLK